jgi:hypothetical protein
MPSDKSEPDPVKKNPASCMGNTKAIEEISEEERERERERENVCVYVCMYVCVYVRVGEYVCTLQTERAKLVITAVITTRALALSRASTRFER